MPQRKFPVKWKESGSRSGVRLVSQSTNIIHGTRLLEWSNIASGFFSSQAAIDGRPPADLRSSTKKRRSLVASATQRQ
jgi:hypothetical protein